MPTTMTISSYNYVNIISSINVTLTLKKTVLTVFLF